MKLHLIAMSFLILWISIPLLAKEDGSTDRLANLAVPDGDPASSMHVGGREKDGGQQVATDAVMQIPRTGTKITSFLDHCKENACLKHTTAGHFPILPCETNETNAYTETCLAGSQSHTPDNQDDGKDQNQ